MSTRNFPNDPISSSGIRRALRFNHRLNLLARVVGTSRTAIAIRGLTALMLLFVSAVLPSFVSSSQPQRKLPDFMRDCMPLAEARVELSKLNLIADVRRAFDTRCRRGTVYNQEPKAGPAPKAGSTVILHVSRGRRPDVTTVVSPLPVNTKTPDTVTPVPTTPNTITPAPTTPQQQPTTPQQQPTTPQQQPTTPSQPSIAPTSPAQPSQVPTDNAVTTSPSISPTPSATTPALSPTVDANGSVSVSPDIVVTITPTASPTGPIPDDRQFPWPWVIAAAILLPASGVSAVQIRRYRYWKKNLDTGVSIDEPLAGRLAPIVRHDPQLGMRAYVVQGDTRFGGPVKFTRKATEYE